MTHPTRYAMPVLTALLSLAATITLRAGDVSKTVTAPESTRYFFGLLDHRSSYGQGILPEPMIIDETDAESEIRLDWFHAKAGSARTDEAKIELEKNFGPVTFEIEVPYERESSPEGVEQGVGNIDIGVRTAVFQYVSPSGFIDTTFGVGFEFGIPTTSEVSKNAEYVPKIFNTLRIGSHFSLQSIAGYSIVSGPGEDSGLHVFEYGFVLGITFQHKEIPIPGGRQLVY